MSEEKKIDRYGWEYYDQVPSDFSLAKFDDFHVNGIKKLGMEFLIRYADIEKYQVCIVSERLTSTFLQPFIKHNRVFTKKESNNVDNHNQSAH